jgi:Kdo2-lipid IVA lauroyltransferase/acyltransferase
MSSLGKVLVSLFTPILLLSSSREVRKRIFTNSYLTLNKLGLRDYINDIENMVEKNISVVIQNRIDYTIIALSRKKASQLLAQFSRLGAIEKLSSAIAKNKGVIVFSSHIGPYFLIPAVLASIGYQVTAVKKLDSLLSYLLSCQINKINKSGTRLSLEMVDTYDRLLLRKLTSDLKRNRIVFMMGDYRGTVQNNNGHIKFLGYDISPARGIAWLSKKTGAPIVPIMFSYKDEDVPQLEVLDEIHIDQSQAIDDITQIVYKTIEERILRAPEKWALWIDYHLMLARSIRVNTKETVQCDGAYYKLKREG